MPLTRSADGVPTFGLGCVKLGNVSSGGAGAGRRLIHEALDLGVRHFDTADAYGSGESERILGQALRRNRSQVTIATKGGYQFSERSRTERLVRSFSAPILPQLDRVRRRVGSSVSEGPPATAASTPRPGAYEHKDFSATALSAALVASLRRLRTDYVDLYQLHGPSAPTDEALTALQAMKAKGQARKIGIGLETLEWAGSWLATGQVDSIQLPFGILDAQAGADVIPDAHAAGVDLVARGVLAAGLLTNSSEAARSLLRPEQVPLQSAVLAMADELAVHPLQLAAWYVTTFPGITTVLIGTGSGAHLRQSLTFVRMPPPPDDIARRLAQLPVLG